MYCFPFQHLCLELAGFSLPPLDDPYLGHLFPSWAASSLRAPCSQQTVTSLHSCCVSGNNFRLLDPSWSSLTEMRSTGSGALVPLGSVEILSYTMATVCNGSNIQAGLCVQFRTQVRPSCGLGLACGSLNLAWGW